MVYVIYYIRENMTNEKQAILENRKTGDRIQVVYNSEKMEIVMRVTRKGLKGKQMVERNKGVSILMFYDLIERLKKAYPKDMVVVEQTPLKVGVLA